MLIKPAEISGAYNFEAPGRASERVSTFVNIQLLNFQRPAYGRVSLLASCSREIPPLDGIAEDE